MTTTPIRRAKNPAGPPRRGFLFGPPAWLLIFPEFHDPFALPSANDANLELLKSAWEPTSPQFVDGRRITINEETPMRKILSVRPPRACCSARPRCASLRAARKIARQGKRCRIRDPCEASPAPPATLPVSGCRTKEANPVSRGPPATPRVNKTQQVDREAAAAALTQGLRRRADGLRRGGSALSQTPGEVRRHADVP